MMYQAYGAQASVLDLIRPVAAVAGSALRMPWPYIEQFFSVRKLAGVLDTFANLAITHSRLPFGITEVQDGDRTVAVTEEVVDATPFASLLRFRKAIDAEQPGVLIVAPMSGHFATLLKATVKTMLSHHDVYITDWANIRDVPLAEGEFGFDAYVDHVIRFLRAMGPGLACRRGVPALRRRARRRRHHGRGRRSRTAAQHDADGGADRYARQSDQGQ